MGIRDLASNLSSLPSIGAQTRTTDLNGDGVDLRGFDSAMVLLAIGIGGITFDGTNRLEFVLQHSDDNSAWAAVAQADVVGATVTGAGIIRALTAAKAAADVQEIGYVGGRRFIRVVADFSGTHATGTPMAATIVRGNAHLAPV